MMDNLGLELLMNDYAPDPAYHASASWNHVPDIYHRRLHSFGIVPSPPHTSSLDSQLTETSI